MGHSATSDGNRWNEARDAVNPRPMDECDRDRIATVLAANNELEIGLGFEAANNANLDDLTDAGFADR